MGTDSPNRWISHQRSDVLGNSVQHGTRRQLRGIQRVHERVAGWSLVAGHPRQQTHSRSED